MAREDLHFRLRIPEDLKSAIEAAAERNRRSMTAEMVERLYDSFGDVFETSYDIFGARTKIAPKSDAEQISIEELKRSIDQQGQIADKLDRILAVLETLKAKD